MKDPANYSSRPSIRYPISYLLLLTWAVCIAMALMGRWGIVAVAASAWLLVALHRKYMMATICLSPFVLLGLLYSAVTNAHPGAEHAQCTRVGREENALDGSNRRHVRRNGSHTD